MTTSQIATCTAAIEALAKASDSTVDDILDVLAGSIIADEDCGEIHRLIARLKTQQQLREEESNSGTASVWGGWRDAQT